MPIRASEKARYPKDWKAISLEVRERAMQRCECRGECGRPHEWHGEDRCDEFNGLPAGSFKGKVVLTVAHLDHTPENCGTPGNRPNLKAYCQRCHLRYDRGHHAETIRNTREANNPTPRML